jgi:glycerol uptake facilitator-like aquaporin
MSLIDLTEQSEYKAGYRVYKWADARRQRPVWVDLWWVIGPSLISRTFPEIQVELLIVGASVAILIAGLILSPPGRATGGHMNPAISLAMWRFGVFRGTGVVPYIIAQLLGSVLGVLVARAVWGPVVAEPQVAYAVLQPGPGWSGAELFVAETLSMAFIVLLVGVCLAAPRLAPFVPWIVGVAIGTAIATLGTSTGGSVNPSRLCSNVRGVGGRRLRFPLTLTPSR